MAGMEMKVNHLQWKTVVFTCVCVVLASFHPKLSVCKNGCDLYIHGAVNSDP